MRKNNLVFIDIETTGFSLFKHEIIEIGCIVTTPLLEVVEEFELKVTAERMEDADPVALKVNKYDSTEWANAISLKDAMKTLADKTKGCIMVGQNVAFDSGFLELAFGKTGVTNSMHHHKLDTMSIAWAKLQNDSSVNNFSLHEMCEKFGIKNEREHTALSDTRATFELYKKLMSI